MISKSGQLLDSVYLTELNCQHLFKNSAKQGNYMFSINIDWSQDYEKYNFIGQSVYNEAHESDEDFDENNEMGTPMMNFGYPLSSLPSNDKILQIVEDTNCTVVEDYESGEAYLALTGGGMDLSQDIALAYIIAQGFIEWDLIDDVHIENPLSVSTEEYLKILADLKKRYEIQADKAQQKLKQIQGKIKEYSKAKVK